MRLQVDSVSLVGVSREISFQPGLNVVSGPISTGKSTLLRLCRVLLGGPVEDLPPEIREHVPSIAGSVRLGDSIYSVVRPLVATDTAKVEIAGDGEAWRLPALRRDATAPTTYGRWLLDRLGLPDIDVATARTRPGDSATTPISINDFLLYCHIPQDEIDASVFGHRDTFKNTKRKYVFEILYGLFDVETAQLQERLRQVQQELRQLQAGVAAFRGFLVDTPWENRAAIERRLAELRAAVASEEDNAALRASEATRIPRAQQLRLRIAELDEQMAQSRAAQRNELQSISDLSRLISQLETQQARLTRSIVTQQVLLDYDFRICPRCGSEVGGTRGGDNLCYLCLQAPSQTVTRLDLIHEQDRLAAQLEETRGLIDLRQGRADAESRRLTELEGQRAAVAADLDAQLQSYVTDQADSIAESARSREELVRSIAQMTDYLQLYGKLDAAGRRTTLLSDQAEAIQSELQHRLIRRDTSERQIDQLEQTFRSLVEEIGIPRFEGEPRAAINRDTFLPIINGRTFGQLSSGGLKVLTNVAYALAHHETAMKLDLMLPGLLMLDGVTKNVGRDEYDWARVEAVFRALIRLAEAYKGELQLIVTANDVPAFAQPFVRLHLTEDGRLVPMPG